MSKTVVDKDGDPRTQPSSVEPKHSAADSSTPLPLGEGVDARGLDPAPALRRGVEKERKNEREREGNHFVLLLTISHLCPTPPLSLSLPPPTRLPLASFQERSVKKT